MFTKPIERLIDAFQTLPGVGPKSAQRLAFHVLKQSPHIVQQFADALVDAKQRVKSCPQCYNLTCEDLCELCIDTHRNHAQLCVVANVQDLVAIEKTHDFKGYYHVLQGLVSPMDGIGIEDLTINPLLNRLNAPGQPVTEVILALPPSVEGDTTSLYLIRQLKPLGLAVSRIAFGIPVGGDLDYADSLTLSKALQGRNAVS